MQLRKITNTNKGSGNRNLADIHKFKLTLPDIGYRNKTWSNLDLALHLKKEVIKILLQHTGSLLQNKLTKHRKKQFNQPLRQISNYVSFTSVSELAENSSSAVNSTNGSTSVLPKVQVSGSDSPSSVSLAKSNSSKPPLQNRTSTLSLEKKPFSRFNLSPSVSRADSVRTIGNDKKESSNNDKVETDEDNNSETASGSPSPAPSSPLQKLRNFTKNEEDGHKKRFLQKLLN